MAREMKNSGIEWIGTIPKEWDTVKFKYLHNGLNTGESIDKDFWTSEENGTVFYTAGLTPIRTSYKEFPTWKYTRNNDILLARNGTPYVYFPVEQACYSDHIIRAAMKDGIIRRFVQYCLQQSIASVVVDTVSIATWSASLWNEQTIPWPSESEQQRIVTYLDAECARIDAVIEQTRESIEEYKKLKQAVITQAVTKGIRPNRPMKDSGVDWIGEIPSEWETTKIKFISSGVGDGLHAAPKFEDGGLYYFINGNNLGEKQIRIKENTNSVSEEEYSKYNQPALSSNAILVALNGTYGLVSFYCGEKIMLGKSAGYINLFPSINRNFVRYALLADCSKRQMDDSLAGTTIANISLRTIKNISITWPSMKEQEEISDNLDCMCNVFDKILTEKMQLISELGSYKKSLIYEYVTGKKEVGLND